MAEVIIQDLEPTLLQKLETQALLNGRSLQAQLKHIIQAAVQAEKLDQSEAKVVSKTPEELGWSPGFFERTALRWEGEPLIRREQGEYEQRLWELL